MPKKRNRDRLDRIVESAERTFGQKVKTVTAPGGEGRSSYRVFMPDRSMVATLRPNFRRTHLEAFALRQLAPYCDLIPRCLGVDGEIMFQADVGGRRLNMEIADADVGRRAELAHEAVTSIFRIQSAGRAAGLENDMPHLGQNPAWIENFIHAIDVFQDREICDAPAVDRDALSRAIDVPCRQFVKWDCRAGNAAVGEDEVLRWFDFEYSGVRHGAEDFAWLIGDESWPLSGEEMEALIRDSFDPACGHTLDAYLDYLALYVTFHCVQRLKLILKEANKRGWLSKARVRKYDDAGVHPEFAAHLSGVGAYFADRNPLTQPIGHCFVAAGRLFQSILRDGLAENGKKSHAA